MSPPLHICETYRIWDLCPAALLNAEQREQWNQFHGATVLSKAVRAAVRFAPWALTGLARVSETRLGGRALYHGIFKRLISKPVKLFHALLLRPFLRRLSLLRLPYTSSFSATAVPL